MKAESSACQITGGQIPKDNIISYGPISLDLCRQTRPSTSSARTYKIKPVRRPGEQRVFFFCNARRNKTRQLLFVVRVK